MITAALNGELRDVTFQKHPVFGVQVPAAVPGVPAALLNPRDTWTDREEYDRTAANLAQKFVNNFQKYASYANKEILAGAPEVVLAEV
jgi:phosphoenolpyruvate carboxykinase (ATP)